MSFALLLHKKKKKRKKKKRKKKERKKKKKKKQIRVDQPRIDLETILTKKIKEVLTFVFWPFDVPSLLARLLIVTLNCWRLTSPQILTCWMDPSQTKKKEKRNKKETKKRNKRSEERERDVSDECLLGWSKTMGYGRTSSISLSHMTRSCKHTSISTWMSSLVLLVTNI